MLSMLARLQDGTARLALGSFKYTTTRGFLCILASCIAVFCSGRLLVLHCHAKQLKKTKQRIKGRDLYGLYVNVCIYIYILINIEQYYKVYDST